MARVFLRPGTGTCTVNGRPIEEYFPTPGQRHEQVAAEELLAHANGRALIGDAGYDSNHFIAAVQAKGMKSVICPRPERRGKPRVDRYEKTARNYLALVQIACAWLWLMSAGEITHG